MPRATRFVSDAAWSAAQGIFPLIILFSGAMPLTLPWRGRVDANEMSGGVG